MSAQPLRQRLESLALLVAVLCAAFVPAALPGAMPGLVGPGTAPVSVQAAAAGSAAAAGVWLLRRRGSRWPLSLIVAVDSAVRGPGLLLSVGVYAAATHYRRPHHRVILAAVATLPAALPLAAAVPGPGVEPASAIGGAALFVWLPLAAGLWTSARAEAVAGLRERAERLERERTESAARARLEERARIARDMHDVVAHRVSLMVLRAGALEINAVDERTAAEAELIRTTGKEALTQLRAVLGVLRRADGEPFGPQPSLADLDQLLDQSRSVGVPVRRRDEGTAAELSVVVEHTAYRVVQEALTNIHKHAGVVATEVAVRHLPSALEVTVRNAAPRERPPEPAGSGLGLLALRERVEVLGGEFTAGPSADGGFGLTARLPT
ncbi:sensor histidine kinase [Streptomyces sp. NPDC014894]|uniref:sensor histidine kinase n=1 Tax=Streptomyces sp. NPDC014894 TaxID=3364931 RepID=UPI0037019974